MSAEGIYRNANTHPNAPTFPSKTTPNPPKSPQNLPEIPRNLPNLPKILKITLKIRLFSGGGRAKNREWGVFGFVKS